MEACIFVDGGCWPNPGPAVCAAVAVDVTGEVILEHSMIARPERATNNIAEYSGLLLGCSIAALAGIKIAHFYSDSQLIVQQTRGSWYVHDEELKVLRARARAALERLESWTIDHVYREHNQRADWLCNELLDHKSKKQLLEIPATEFIYPHKRRSREAGLLGSP